MKKKTLIIVGLAATCGLIALLPGALSGQATGGAGCGGEPIESEVSSATAAATASEVRPNFGHPAPCAAAKQDPTRDIGPMPKDRPFPQVMSLLDVETDEDGNYVDGMVYSASATMPSSEGYEGQDAADFTRDFGCIDFPRGGVVKDIAKNHPEAAVMKWTGWGVVLPDPDAGWREWNLGAKYRFPMFAGHWLFKTGSVINATVRAPDSACEAGGTFETTVSLTKNSKRFQKDDLVMIHRYGAGGAMAHDWSTVEHAVVKADPIAVNSLTLTRFCDFALAWKTGDGEVRIAPHYQQWGGTTYTGLAVNMSLSSPKSPGSCGSDEWACLSGWEFWARFSATRYRWYFGDEAKAPHGPQIDGARWLAVSGSHDWDNWEKHPIDVNNDNEADWGYLNGSQTYGLGGVHGVARLRELICQPSPDVVAGSVLDGEGSAMPKQVESCGNLLNLDSTMPSWGYRQAGFANGIEVENPEANHTGTGEYFSGFASGAIHLRQSIAWVKAWGHYDALSYSKTKTSTASYYCNDEATVIVGPTAETGGMNSRFRVGMALNTMVGMPHNHVAEKEAKPRTVCHGLFDWDEYHGGDLNRYRWLGYPSSTSPEAIQVLDNLGSAIPPRVGKGLGSSWKLVKSSCKTSSSSASNTAYRKVNTSTDQQVVVQTVCDTPFFDGIAIERQLFESSGHKQLTVDFSAAATNTYPKGLCSSMSTTLGRNICRYLPRLLRVTLLFENASGTVKELYQDIQLKVSSLGDKTSLLKPYTPYKLTFLEIDDTWTLTGVRFASGEQAGSFTIRDAKVLKGSPERWVRYFENGAVLLNMSEDDWTYSLDSRESCKGYVRLLGTQDEVNDGKWLGKTSEPIVAGCYKFLKIKVPAKDAIFLRKAGVK